MNKGRRYDADRELNIKKVIAVIIAFAVISIGENSTLPIIIE